MHTLEDNITLEEICISYWDRKDDLELFYRVNNR